MPASILYCQFEYNSSRRRSWIDLALDLVLSGKLTSSKQMNKREAKKRWKIFSTKIAGNYFPVENIFHRADEFSLIVQINDFCPEIQLWDNRIGVKSESK